MLKKQYLLYVTNGNNCYFNNFIKSLDEKVSLSDSLKAYDAVVANSKHHYKVNVKWYNKELYCFFKLEWA